MSDPPKVTLGRPVDTPLGRVAGLPDGRVWLETEPGTFLSNTEAHDLARALMHAAFEADRYNARVTGRHRPRISFAPDGTLLVTILDRLGSTKDETRRMRLSELRKERRCRACEKPSLRMYVEIRESHGTFAGRPILKPSIHTEICESCVTAARLLADVGTQP